MIWCVYFSSRVKKGTFYIGFVSLCKQTQVVNVTAADLDKVHEAIIAVLQEVHTKLSQEESNV